jgi:hypothetical protein
MRESRKFKSDFLFPTPSFLIGAGSVLNIAGNYFVFNYSPSDVDADVKALMSDWGVIGEDIEVAEAEIMKILEVKDNG